MATLSDLKEVKEALDAGLVSQADFNKVKRDYLSGKEECQKLDLQAKKEALEANKEFQKRESDAKLRTYALESIVKHGSSIMSEEQKVDLARDYAKTSGLNRGATVKAGPSSKRQRIKTKKEDAAPPQTAAPPRTPPAPVVPKPNLSQGTLLFHKIEDYPIWPIRVMSWDPFDKTDPAQCRVPDGIGGTTNYYEYPDKKKEKEVLILYLGKDADFVSENKSSNRFLSWSELKDDLKAWVDGSLDDNGLKAKHKKKIAGEDYFQGLKNNSEDYKAALEDAFEYLEKRDDQEWLWNEAYMYKKYGYHANWEESKRAEFEARRQAQGAPRKRIASLVRREEEEVRLSQLSEAQLKDHFERERSKGKITADGLLRLFGSLEEGEKGKRKVLMNELAKCQGYGYLANGFMKDTCCAAAKNGHLDVLKWLRSQDPPCSWGEGTCSGAAIEGRLDALKWLRSQDPPCPWNAKTCEWAASYGHLDVLKWLRSQDPPCPWGERTCAEAAMKGHLDVLKWLIDNGCPYDVNGVGKSSYEELGLA